MRLSTRIALVLLFAFCLAFLPPALGRAEPVLGFSYLLPNLSDTDSQVSQPKIFYLSSEQKTIVVWEEKVTERGSETTYLRVAKLSYDGQVEATARSVRPGAVYGPELEIDRRDFRYLFITWSEWDSDNSCLNVQVWGVDTTDLSTVAEPFSLAPDSTSDSNPKISYLRSLGGAYESGFLVAWTASPTAPEKKYIEAAFFSIYPDSGGNFGLIKSSPFTIVQDQSMDRILGGLAFCGQSGVDEWMAVYEGRGDNRGIYAARIALGGTILQTDIVIYSDTLQSCSDPKIYGRDWFYFIIWSTEFSGYKNISGKRVGREGDSVGGLLGISATVNTCANAQIAEAFNANTGSWDYLVTWAEKGSSDTWDLNGRLITEADSYQPGTRIEITDPLDSLSYYSHSLVTYSKDNPTPRVAQSHGWLMALVSPRERSGGTDIMVQEIGNQ